MILMRHIELNIRLNKCVQCPDMVTTKPSLFFSFHRHASEPLLLFVSKDENVRHCMKTYYYHLKRSNNNSNWCRLEWQIDFYVYCLNLRLKAVHRKFAKISLRKNEYFEFSFVGSCYHNDLCHSLFRRIKIPNNAFLIRWKYISKALGHICVISPCFHSYSEFSNFAAITK